MSRQQIYTLLIAISAAMIFGRIIAIDRYDYQLHQTWLEGQIPLKLQAKENRLRQLSSDEEAIAAELEKTRRELERNAMFETPMLSANDRSRWCTIRALVEPDFRVIRTALKEDGTQRNEYVWYAIDKVQTLKGWDTIDMVKHCMVNRGQPDCPLYHCPYPDGKCDRQPACEEDLCPDRECGLSGCPRKGYLYSSKPPLLPTLMAVPYAAIYWGSGTKISLGTEPHFVVRTMLVLLNLIPLVFCWLLLSRLIDRFGTTDWGRIFAAAFICFGTFMSAFAVTLNNHLPGVVSVTIAMYCAVRIFFDDEKRLRYFFLAGLFGTFAAVCELPALAFCALLGLALLWKAAKPALLGFLPGALIVAAGFFATNYAAHQTFVPAYGKKEWYSYAYERGGRILPSHWDNRKGIDEGEESHLTYLLHTTAGHHGIFSLTPVWILSFAGLGCWMFRDRRYRNSALAILALTIIVYVFYLFRPQVDRNYGGWTCGLRWMFWFIPLWSVPLVAAVDRLAHSAVGRSLCLVLLAASILSVVYPWNPWTHPWIYHLMVWLDYPLIGVS